MSDENENKTLECMSDAVLDIDEEDPKRMRAVMACADAFEYRITWTGDNGSDRGYHVFDHDPKSGRWQTDHLYTGTNGRYDVGGDLPPTIGENNANYLGEWIQVELPTPKAIDEYAIVCGSDYSPMRTNEGFPGAWVVLGSMTGDNRSWVRVHGRAMNRALWERNAGYVLDDQPEKMDEPFFVRLVGTSRYLASSEDPASQMTWCTDKRVGNTGNFTTMMLPSKPTSDADKERATFVRKLGHGPSNCWGNAYLLRVADKCSHPDGVLSQEQSKIAYLGIHYDNITYFAWAGGAIENLNTVSAEASMPSISKQIRRVDQPYFISTRTGVVTSSESEEWAGNQLGGGPKGAKRPETYHWVLETEDRDKANYIVNAKANSGKIDSSTAYKYYRIVFQSAAGGSSINVNNIAIKFKDGTAAGGGGPRWVEGNWTPTCTSADPNQRVTRDVTCRRGREDVSESLCTSDKPDDESTCDKVYRPPASSPSSGAADIRAFFADWGLIIVLSVVGFIVLIVMLQLLN